MRSFFDLSHVFVIFHPGSGGNFVSGLINKFVTDDLTALGISRNGTSHTIDNLFMSFGRTPDDQIFYPSSQAREEYYLKKINECYVNITVPQVSWTHDYSNINFYKKHFKNSKLVCITANTPNEKLACTFMNVTKMMLDNPDNWPVSTEVRKFRTLRLERACKIILTEILKPEYVSAIDKIYELRFTEEYKSLFTLVYMRLVLLNLGLVNYVLGTNADRDVFDYVICPSSDIKSKYYTIGPKISEYTDQANYLLPYESIINSDSNAFEKMVSYLLGRELTVDEATFVKKSVKTYTNAQNQQLLSDPIGYYQSVKRDCSMFIKPVVF